jgi:mediator of RNA polymerase II transcription subunit 18, fungi type
VPVDPAGRWTIRIRALVVDDSTPDSIRAAHERLLAIQTRFQGVLDFPVFDRRVHDTRIAPRISETPIPLPRGIAAVRGAARG